MVPAPPLFWIKAVTPLSQAEIVPFKLAKMKCAELPSPPFPTGNDAVLVLLTWPVGPCGPVAVVGIAMLPVGGLTAVTLVTVVLSVTAKRVAVLVPWFEVQKGLVLLCETPQGLRSSGSVILASPGMSETRLT